METEEQSYQELSGINAKTLLNRQLPEYMDIEKCSTSYELRYVLAYEAAIRNEDILSALHDYIKTESTTSRNFLYLHGFNEVAIFFYRMTHTEVFPIQANDTPTKGLSSVEARDSALKPTPYKLTPLCPKTDAVMVNDSPLKRGRGSIARANIDDYSSFNRLLFESRFIRPKLSPPAEKKFIVELNFELPESELQEYVLYLHKLYHSHSAPGTIELLADIELEKEQLKKANIIRYADMLYAYDFKKKFEKMFSKKQDLYEKIQMDLAYTSPKEESKILSPNTIRNYIITMRDIVENHGYRNFLTGIK